MVSTVRAQGPWRRRVRAHPGQMWFASEEILPPRVLWGECGWQKPPAHTHPAGPAAERGPAPGHHITPGVAYPEEWLELVLRDFSSCISFQPAITPGWLPMFYGWWGFGAQPHPQWYLWCPSGVPSTWHCLGHSHLGPWRCSSGSHRGGRGHGCSAPP